MYRGLSLSPVSLIRLFVRFGEVDHLKKENNKSTYYKLFRFSFVIISFAVLLIGIASVAFSTLLFRNERINDISIITDIFIDSVKTGYAESGSIYSDNIADTFESFSKRYDITFYIYDADGNCLIAPDGESHEALSKKVIDQINKNNLPDLDASDISSKEPSLVYGDRFTVRTVNTGEKPTRLYITSHSSTDSLNQFTLKVTVFMIIISIIILSAAYCLMNRKAKLLADDASEFLRVSKNFSKGDFSEHIVIKNAGNLQDISKYVNALADNMANSDDTSKTFIANVSHELRTPITTIGGFVDGILDGTIPKSEQQEYLYLVSNEIKRLSILISSMLNMTRFESGTLKPNFKEANLTELVIKTVLMFEKKIDDKDVNIEGLDCDRLTAVIDSDLIQQVIYNLVENAIKFVNKGGTVSFAFEKNEGICTVSIRNTGEGLKNEEIQQVFDRFYKTDSSRGKDTTGLGLGLSISRKIIHLHNGHIVVRSVYGEYTEFSIQIPEKQN